MRKTFTIRDTDFDTEEWREKIDEIVEKFAIYLETYTPSGGSGLTSMLGPAGKILNKLKSEPHITFKALAGFGSRAHEMRMNYIDHATLELLTEATKTVYDYIPTIPLSYRDKTFEMIHYGLYYLLRKESVEGRDRYLKALKSAYVDFLKSEYGSIEDFNNAAQTTYDNFTAVSLPTKYRIDKMKENEKTIAKAFLENWDYNEE